MKCLWTNAAQTRAKMEVCAAIWSEGMSATVHGPIVGTIVLCYPATGIRVEPQGLVRMTWIFCLMDFDVVVYLDLLVRRIKKKAGETDLRRRKKK